MNSYHIDLAGSWWLLLLLLLIAAGFSFFTYRRTVPDLPPGRKALLISLRIIAIFLLLFVLFEPIFTLIRGAFEKPKLAVLLDNSLSMSLKDAKSDRKTDYISVLEKTGFMNLDESQRKIISFDSDIKEYEKFNQDSLSLKGQMTDISKAFKWVNNNLDQENIGAVLLITDGAFNTGNNPIYQADMTGRRVYIVGIGDSTEPKDVSVQSVLTNDVAYIDNPVPVNVNVKVSGYNSGTVKVDLSDNGSQVSEQTFNITPSQQNYSLVFEYDPKIEGVRKLTATVSNMEGELTLKNNSLSEFINVLKNKRKIVIFSGEPNPDLTFLRNVFQSEKGVEVSTFIQKKGAEFFEGQPTKAALHEAELFVLIGFPISSSPSYALDMIKDELAHGKPCLFIASQYLDYTKLRTIEDYLPFVTISSKPQEFVAIGDFRKEALSNSILKISGANTDLDLWNQLPPIFRTETFVRVKPESEVLAGIKVNNTPMKEPLLVTRSFQNQKSVAILGYGLFRWKLLGYAAELAKGRKSTPDLYDILFLNIHRWLSVNQEYKNVVIKTTKKIFNKGERVEFYGQIYDATYSPVDNAYVTVKINNGLKTNEITLNSIGNGRYSGFADGLDEGDYFYSDEAKLNNQSLGRDNGRFNVGDVSIEYLDLKMNVGLLRTIAERTGGKFYLPENSGKFLSDLQSSPDFKPKALTIKKEYSLWNLPWILALAILLLSIEWYLRKRSGLL